MRSYGARALIDCLETARIYAGSEFEKLCNNDQHIDACVFQSIRDSIKQNMELLQSYVTCKNKENERCGMMLKKSMETLSLLKNSFILDFDEGENSEVVKELEWVMNELRKKECE